MKLKIFFLSLFISLFSFCFISKVYAIDSFTMGNGIVIDQTYIDNLWDTYIEGKNSNNMTYSSSSDPLYTKQYTKGDFNYILIYPYDNNRFYIGWFDTSQITYSSESSSNIQFVISNPSNSTGFAKSPSINFNTSTNRVQSYFGNYPGTIDVPKSNSAHLCNIGAGNKVCYNNFDLIYNDVNYLTNNFDYVTSSSITFNFHLNGGHASSTLLTPVVEFLLNDSEFSISSDDYDIDTFFSNLIINNDPKVFDNFYYDSNFTHPFSMKHNHQNYHSY